MELNRRVLCPNNDIIKMRNGLRLERFSRLTKLTLLRGKIEIDKKMRPHP